LPGLAGPITPQAKAANNAVYGHGKRLTPSPLSGFPYSAFFAEKPGPAACQA